MADNRYLPSKPEFRSGDIEEFPSLLYNNMKRYCMLHKTLKLPCARTVWLKGRDAEEDAEAFDTAKSDHVIGWRITGTTQFVRVARFVYRAMGERYQFLIGEHHDLNGGQPFFLVFNSMGTVAVLRELTGISYQICDVSGRQITQLTVDRITGPRSAIHDLGVANRLRIQLRGIGVYPHDEHALVSNGTLQTSRLSPYSTFDKIGLSSDESDHSIASRRSKKRQHSRDSSSESSSRLHKFLRLSPACPRTGTGLTVNDYELRSESQDHKNQPLHETSQGISSSSATDLKKCMGNVKTEHTIAPPKILPQTPATTKPANSVPDKDEVQVNFLFKKHIDGPTIRSRAFETCKNVHMFYVHAQAAKITTPETDILFVKVGDQQIEPVVRGDEIDFDNIKTIIEGVKLIHEAEGKDDRVIDFIVVP